MGECFFWYRPTQVVPDQRPLNGCDCRGQMSLYRKIPLKFISRLWGQFNQLVLPTWLRRPALRLYIWMFGCRLEDAAVQDLTKYRNLSEFFRRNLRPGIRPIDSTQILVSVSASQ